MSSLTPNSSLSIDISTGQAGAPVHGQLFSAVRADPFRIFFFDEGADTHGSNTLKVGNRADAVLRNIPPVQIPHSNAGVFGTLAAVSIIGARQFFAVLNPARCTVEWLGGLVRGIAARTSLLGAQVSNAYAAIYPAGSDHFVHPLSSIVTFMVSPGCLPILARISFLIPIM